MRDRLDVGGIVQGPERDGPSGRFASVDLGSTRAAGHLSAVLFFLCGVLVAATAPLTPAGPGVHHGVQVLAGVLAAAGGVGIGALPWGRWPRTATLALVPVACALIALHNWSTGANGLRFDVFFFVVAAWIGLMHPSGTTLASVPVMVAAYLAPGLFGAPLGVLAGALTYAVPGYVLIGECSSLVAERVRRSEEQLAIRERRFRALVQNASDVIMVLGPDGSIQWESPGVETVLGYAPNGRPGANGLDFIRPDHLPAAMQELTRLLTAPGMEACLELPVRHANGEWRWCEARARNLLDEPAVAGIVVNYSDITERHHAEELQRHLAAIVESSSDAISGLSTDGTVLSWNGAAERMYGISAAEAVGGNIGRVVPAGQIGDLDALLARVAAGETLDHVTTTRVRRDGSRLHVLLSMAPVRGGDGAVVAVAAIERDITAQLQAADALAHTAASFRLLFFHNPQPMWVYDRETLRFLEVNGAAVEHYGWSREQFLARTVLDIRPPADAARLLDDLAADRMSRESSSWRHLLADGRLIDVDITSHRLDFNGRDAVLVAVQDVTDRNALEVALRHQAFHDALTGLANRALFGDRVEHALAGRGGAAPVVLLLDLDRFKVINDSLGHSAGDQLLVAVAERLRTAVRGGDTVARLGGDEFAVLLDHCPPGVDVEQAQRLLDAIALPVDVEGKQVVVTGSVGIARADATTSAGELLRNADMAMYRAKSAGGGRHRSYEPTMLTDALHQMELAASLRQAIDDQEFLLHYQPLVNAGDGRIVGMEALVRWQHNGALLGPGEFIPALEDNGLIVALGEWILRRACADAAAWDDPSLRVNVNLSGRQLVDPDIVSHVRQALTESGLAPAQLMLEITESVLMQDGEASVRLLSQLKALGVGLAIDDFGTGYSSLAYLRTFPVDELKIDRSFVATIPEDPTAVPLVRTIVELARSLGLRTVAEGVELSGQYDVLRELGCDEIQGFLVSRPQPVDDALVLRELPPHWAPSVTPTRRPSSALIPGPRRT